MSRRFCLGFGLFVLSIGQMSGCNIAQAVETITRPDPVVEAKYELPLRPTVIMFDDQRSIVTPVRLRRDVAEEATVVLMECADMSEMISPMDALGLINHLNSSAAQGVGGEGESRVDLSEAVIAAPVVVQTTDNETFPRFAVFQTGEPSDSAGDVIVDRPASLPDANRAAQPDGRHDASTFDDDAADELVDVDVILSDDMAEDIYAAWTGRGATGDLLAELL